MPLATLLLPAALLAAAALLSCALGLAGVDAGRTLTAAAAWAATATLAIAWFVGGRTPLDLGLGQRIAVVPLQVRLDPVVVAFALTVLVPVALLLTFQRRTWRAAAPAALTAALAVLALGAGSVVLTALALSAAAGLVLFVLRQEEEGRTRHLWIAITTAWLLLSWAGVRLIAAGGTSVYGAVPVTALGAPVFALLAVAGVLCAGVLPWRTWVSETWARQRLQGGSLAVAVLVPLGLYPLVRAYGLGAGQWPSAPLSAAVAVLGAATAVGAAIRAQAASTRRGVLAETIPMGAGLALFALALGTPLGLVAAVTTVAGIGVTAGLAPLVPEDRGPLALVALLVCAGAPPAIAFGGWLLALQAALEASTSSALLVPVVAAAWLLMLAAAVRSLGLPFAPRGAAPAGSAGGGAVGTAVALTAGVGLTAVIAELAIPAAAQVMPAGVTRGASTPLAPAAILAAGTPDVSTASGGWSPVLLGVPLLAVAAAVVLAAWALRTRAARAAAIAEPGAPVASAGPEPPEAVVLEAPPAPLFSPPLAGVPERLAQAVMGARLPDQYRGLLRPELLERAVTHAPPLFWVATAIVLAVAVTR